MHQILLKKFESKGYTSNSLFSFNRIKSHLDLIIKQNSSQAITSFDYDLAQQIWNQSQKTMSGEVLLIHFIRVSYQARQIIQNRIKTLQSSQILIQDIIVQKSIDLSNNQKYYMLIKQTNSSSKYKTIGDQILNKKKQLQSHRQILEENLRDQKLLAYLFQKQQNQYQFNIEQRERRMLELDYNQNSSEVFIERSNSVLKVAFILIILFLGFQPFILLIKQSFLTLLAGISLLSIFLLDFLTPSYVRFCLLLLFLNLIFDILWFFCKGINIWDPHFINLQLTMLHSYASLYLIFFFITFLCKLGVTAILLSYARSVEPSSIQLFGIRFNMTGTTKSLSTRIDELFL